MFVINDDLVFKIQKYLFFLIPISFIVGQTAVAIIFFSIILSSIFCLKKITVIFKKYRNYDIAILFFFIYLLFSSFFKDPKVLVNSILLLRFLLFYFVVKYIVLNFSTKDFKIFLRVILFCSIFVIMDLLYEKHFGFDIFGFGKPLGSELRLTGPFRNEPIPGSYLLNIGFYSFVIIYSFSSEVKTTIVKMLIPILIIIFGLSIFITGERISFIMFLFLISLIFFFFIKIKKVVFFSLIFIFIGAFIISSKNNYYQERYLNFLNNIGISENFEKYHNNNFFDSQWGAHILTAYEMYKENNLTGIGVRQFRVICSNQNYEKIKSKSANIRCSTHPHNLYFEILSETGLIGFSLFTIFLFLIFIDFIKIFKSSNKDYIYTLSVYTFCVFFMLFWPIRSTGSFFSNFNGSVYWLTISLFSGLLLKQDLKNNNR